MGLIPSLTSFSAATTAKSSEVNANFTSVRDTFNTYAVLTDTAKTISVTHTYTSTQTFTGGWTAGAGCTVSTGGLTVTAGGLTVSSGTTAVQAVTCAALTASGAFQATTGLFTGSALNVTGTGAYVKTLDTTVDNRFYSDNGNGWGAFGTFSAHDLYFVSGGVTRGNINHTTGIATFDARLTATAGIVVSANGITVSSGGVTVTGNSSVTGTLAVSSTVTGGTYNSQTISSSANFTGSVTVANGLTVSAGTSSLQAMSATTATITTMAGSVDFSGTPTFAAISMSGNLTFTGTSTKIVPANSGTWTLRNGGDSANVLAYTVATAVVALGSSVVDVQCGAGTLATSANSGAGHLLIPMCAGTPTGTASNGSFILDSTASKLWARVGGTWKYAALT